jgi:hypothetical protein
MQVKQGVLCYLEPSIVFKAKVARHVRIFCNFKISSKLNHCVCHLRVSGLILESRTGTGVNIENVM